MAQKRKKEEKHEIKEKMNKCQEETHRHNEKKKRKVDGKRQ